MSRAGRAESFETKVMGNRGIASRVLRSLSASLPLRGTRAFSGQASHRQGRVMGGAVLAAFALALTAAPSASATKYFDSFIGGTGATGGLFSSSSGGVGDIAVNDPVITSDGVGQSGYIYVADRGNNRIQVFDSNKVFQFAIGRDVVAAGGTGDTNEKQSVTIGGAPTGGTFTLTFGANTTAPIAFDADGAAVDAALEGIASVGAGNASVTGAAGGPYAVEFVGARASVDQAQMTANAAGLTGGTAPTVTVATTQDGASFEKCTVAAQCKIGTNVAGANNALGNGGTFNTAAGIDIDQATGHLFVRERNANARVQEFTATGSFVRAFGWDVVVGGVTTFETCNAAAADVCKAGVTGAGVGQTGSSTATAFAGGMAVGRPGAPNAGKVYAADPTNRRVLVFSVPASPTGAVVADPSFGTSADFSSNHPTNVATDTNGVVYATDTMFGAQGRVVRFDTTAPSAVLAPIEGGGSANVLGDAGGGSTGIEVDPATDHLLFTRTPALGVVELDLTAKPVNVSTANIVDRHLVGLLGTSPLQGIGAGRGPSRHFVSTPTNVPATGVGQRVLVVDEDGVNPSPTVELLPPTNVGCSTATLQANINPNGPTGFATNYRFQVSKTGVDGDWTDVAADQLVGATGDGGAPVFIDDVGTGLEPNSVYRVRVRTQRNPAAGVALSAELIFATDPCPPTVETIAASRVADTSGQLNGRIDPGGLATSYWFEWGDNDYGKTLPVPATSLTGTVPRFVSEQLVGLVPDAVYHYRLCAQNALSASKVCGADRTITTRSPTAPSGNRAYEMVTSPDKALRRGGEGGAEVTDYSRLATGIPTADGNSLGWSVFAGISDPDAGQGFTNHHAFEIRRRTAAGWRGEAVQTPAPLHQNSVGLAEPYGASADFGLQVWLNQASMYSSALRLSTHVQGDHGGPRAAGWYPLLDPDWIDVPMLDLQEVKQIAARVDDGGEAYVGWSPTDEGQMLRPMAPQDGGAAPKDLSPPQVAGQAPFMFRRPDWRPVDLINECTGISGDATVLPTRIGTGVQTDTIGGRTCEAGSPTSVRGAILSAASGDRLVSYAPRMLSEGARRVFFASPDPAAAMAPNYGSANVGGNGRSACAGQYVDSGFPFGAPQPPAVASLTACPAQLFVRQYDDQGNATVRWISRAEDALFDAPHQEIGMFGNGASFEGASRDGSVVYFRTNAPLTVDDVNGGTPSLRTGEASHLSWDLYRYELPSDLNADPGEGNLTRISAGPEKATGAGDTTAGSSTITNVVTDSGTFAPGQVIAGPGISAGTTVSGVAGATIALSQSATATATGVALRAAADPNTNCTSPTSDCGGANPAPDHSGGQGNGAGGAARYVSNDGDKVYFVTTSRIGAAAAPWNTSPSGGVTAPGGAASANIATRNLYLYDAAKSGDDAYQFIARLPSDIDVAKHAACATTATNPGGAPRRTSRSTASLYRNPLSSTNCVHGTTSGDAIVFETVAQLTTDDHDQAVDVYLYNASDNELVRVSAPPAGAEPYFCLDGGLVCNGDLGIMGGPQGEFTTDGGSSVGTDGLSHFNLAEDGSGSLTAVFFESRQSLVPQDINGDRMDVYEWRNGRVSLISPGAADDSAFFTGSSRDGTSVFFATEQPIDFAREIDLADNDIYNATTRTDRLPDPPTSPAVCAVLAGGCQGAGAQDISVAPQTDKASVGGTVVSGPRPVISLRKPSASQRRKAWRSGVLSVSVRTSKAGKVSAVAKGRVGKRTQQVARKSIQVHKAGKATLRLRLNRAARQRLKSGRNLNLTIQVRSPGARSRSMSVRLPGASS